MKSWLRVILGGIGVMYAAMLQFVMWFLSMPLQFILWLGECLEPTEP